MISRQKKASCGSLLAKIQGAPGITVTVSPDRKTFLFVTSVTSGSDLMLVENFR